MSLEERYSKKSNSIFLFGGAFDPIHNGHIQIAKEIFQKFMPLEFFFIPSNNPPHKNIITPYKNRVEMLELALNKQSPFKISYIKKKINLVLGFDSFLDLPNWYKFEDLLANANFYVINRRGENQNKLCSSSNLQKKNIHFIENINLDVSSEKIRRKIKSKSNIKSSCAKEVIEYIQKHNLYGY
jgi:nicotinate-nucleotide adenylyltransferase